MTPRGKLRLFGFSVLSGDAPRTADATDDVVESPNDAIDVASVTSLAMLTSSPAYTRTLPGFTVTSSSKLPTSTGSDWQLSSSGVTSLFGTDVIDMDILSLECCRRCEFLALGVGLLPAENTDPDSLDPALSCDVIDGMEAMLGCEAECSELRGVDCDCADSAERRLLTSLTLAFLKRNNKHTSRSRLTQLVRVFSLLWKYRSKQSNKPSEKCTGKNERKA